MSSIKELNALLRATQSTINTFKATRRNFKVRTGGLNLSKELFSKGMVQSFFEKGFSFKKSFKLAEQVKQQATGGAKLVKQLKKQRKREAVKFVRIRGRIVPIRKK